MHLKNISMGAKLAKKTEGLLITWKVLFGQLHIPQAAFLVVKIPQSTTCPHRVFAINSVFRDKSAVSERPTLFTAPTNKRLHPQREEERSYYSTLTWRMQLMEYKHFTDLGFAKSTFKMGHLWRRWDVWIAWRKFESSQVSFIMETASQQLAPTYFQLWCVAAKCTDSLCYTKKAPSPRCHSVHLWASGEAPVRWILKF